MRQAGKILSYIGLGLVVLIGLVFAFIELRSLFAGDFSLFNNPASAFFRYLFRGLYYLAIVGMAIVTIVTLIRKKETNVYLTVVSASLLISSGFTVIFYQFYFAIGVMVVCLILFGVNFAYLSKKVNDTPQAQ